MSRLKRMMLAAGLAIGICNLGYAAKRDSLEPAIAALKQGDAKAAVNYLVPLAKRGNAEAQFMLVSALQAIDQQQAVFWLRAAADNKQPNACHILGLMYLQGNGVAEDLQQARKWLTIAAEKGIAAAQLQLATSYRNGPIAQQDDAAAFKWMKTAAEGGNAEAQFRLAEMYRYGYGVAADGAEMQKWLQRAAQQGYAEAVQALGGSAR